LGAFSEPTVRDSPELASIIFSFYSCLFLCTTTVIFALAGQ
jgi:hypothetical protein